MYGVAAATCFCATRTQWPRAHRRQRCKRLSCNLCAEAAASSEPAARGISGRLTANRLSWSKRRLDARIAILHDRWLMARIGLNDTNCNEPLSPVVTVRIDRVVPTSEDEE